MKITRIALSPPCVQELADVLTPALQSNYIEASAAVVECPDLRQLGLATEGLHGDEVTADIGGQAYLYPLPRDDKIYSLLDLAKQMNMSPDHGSLFGAGAAPYQVLGWNAELALNLSWKAGFNLVNNLTRGATYSSRVQSPLRPMCACTNNECCGMMANLYGSKGLPGKVLRIYARGRKGEGSSITEFIRDALTAACGKQRQISLGGVFVMKKGSAKFHIMPDFPPKAELPFTSTEALDEWLTYHEFKGPMVCLAVIHSGDPEKLGIRSEHTHCYSPDKNEGGHYHYDLVKEGEEVEYEGYFNTAKTFFQIDYTKP